MNKPQFIGMTLPMFVQCVGYLGQSERAVRAAEAWLGLEEADYGTVAELSAAVDAAWERKQLYSAPNQSNLVRVLADALGFVPGREARHAALLLEAWLGVDPWEFAESRKYVGLPVGQRLEWPRSWLNVADATSDEAYRTCEAVHRLIVDTREFYGSAQQRRDFLENVRSIREIDWQPLREAGEALGVNWSRTDGDDPLAARSALSAMMNQADTPFDFAAFGGHGADTAGGVLFSGGVWDGGGADLSSLDLLLLVACAVGRLAQDGQRDVEGLYAKLVAQGCRAVIAARWPIADTEAAVFATILADEYLTLRKETAGQTVPFLRARALNRARRLAVSEQAVTEHLAAAFDLYGYG